MARFRQFLWLVVLGLLFAASVPAPASVFGSGQASRPGVEIGSINACAFVTVPYDAPSRGGISYDGGALRDYVYDADSMRAAGEKENGMGGSSAVLAKFAEILAAKGIPNPGGKLGDALTRQTAANVINDLKASGFTDVSQEVLFQKGPLGLKNRFADIVGVNPQSGESLILNIGKQTKSGIPIMRERMALDDIIFSPTIQNYPNSRLLFIEKGASGLPPGL